MTCQEKELGGPKPLAGEYPSPSFLLVGSCLEQRCLDPVSVVIFYNPYSPLILFSLLE